jgi:hypothetical protein
VPVAPGNFFDWREQNHVFGSIAAAELWGANLTGADRPEQITGLRVSLSGSKYAEPARRAAFYRELLDRLRALPGVSAAGAVNHIPLQGDVWSDSFTVEGQAPPAPDAVPAATYRVIQPGYLRAMGIALARGRDVDERDTEGAPGVVIVNESLARRYWPNEEALGRRIRSGEPDSRKPWLTVVGVVRNVMQWQWEEEPPPEFYVPFLQDSSSGDGGSLATSRRAARFSYTGATRRGRPGRSAEGAVS